MDLQQKKLIFVTGKGGVGKTTLSLLLARGLSLKGNKVLLVELGRRSSAKHLALLQTRAQFAPEKTSLGFDHCLIDGKDCLEDYISYIVRMETLTNLFLKNRFMRAMIPLAPGLDDLAILGKLTSHIRKHGPPLEYDNIIIDSHSTGAFLSMLKSPLHLSEMVSIGPLNYHSLKIFDVLRDSSLCHFVFATLLESFPIEELQESTDDFAKTFQVPFSIVVNRALPDFSLEGTKPEAYKDFLVETFRFQDDFLNHLRTQYKDLSIQPYMKKSLRQSLDEGEICHNLIS